MREILFRGKTGLLDGSKTWVNGSLITYPHNGKAEISTYKGYSAFAGSHMVEVREVYPETIGQYTGLEDKNGVKIFEGDILSVALTLHHEDFSYTEIRKKWRSAVTYENGSFKITEEGGLYPLCDYILSGLHRIEYEVIGNIYDNPDLLES